MQTRWLQLAEALRRAADSNLALFDAIIIDAYARQTGHAPRRDQEHDDVQRDELSVGGRFATGH